MTKHISNSAPNKALSKELFDLTWPMIFGVLSLMSFQLADSIFIARLGTEPLAAIGFTIPIYQLIIGVQVGIGIATTALIAQRIGANQDQDARSLGTTILIFGACSVLGLNLLIWLFRSILYQALGVSPDIFPLLDDLWPVFLLSAFVGALLYFCYSICRAHGDTLLPGMMMVATSLLNIALDPVFIFYFDLGLPGAAWASLCAFSIGFCIVFPKVVRRNWIRLNHQISLMMKQVKQVWAIALPAMSSQLMPSASAIIATNIVADYGTEAVAAWGLGVRIEFFSIVVVLALTMSLPPMVGRFYGAGNRDAMRQVINIALLFVLVWQLMLAVGLAMYSLPLSTLMTPETAVASQLSSLIQIIPWSYAPLGICMICVSACNALGAPKRALGISALRLFACYLPCLILGGVWFDLTGLFAGAALGNLLAGLLAWRLMQSGIKKAPAA